MNSPHLLTKQFKALVVNDSILERNWLTKAASSAGFLALQATSGDNILDLIEREHVDLLICDDEKPAHTTAPQLCQAVRQSRFDFPVHIVLTGTADTPATLLRGLQAGADDYLLKPLQRADVEMRLQSAALAINLVHHYHQSKAQMPAWLQTSAREMRALGRHQASMLPDRGQAMLQGIELDYFWLPKVFVSGDMLQWLPLDEQNAIFFLFDVVGHGVPAALSALDICQLLSAKAPDGLLFNQDDNAYHQQVRSPSDILKDLNNRFQMEKEGDSFVSMLLGVLNHTSGELVFSVAGTPRLAHQNLQGQVQLVGESELPLGIAPHTHHPQNRLQLAAGERVFIFSDGLTQMLDQADTPLALAGVINLLALHQGQGLNEQVLATRQGIEHWSSGKGDQRVLDDDCTLLGFQWKRPEAADTPDTPEITEEIESLDIPANPDTSKTSDTADLHVTAPTEETKAPNPLARRKENSTVVLLCDKTSSAQLQTQLETWGYTVLAAKNTEQATQHLRNTHAEFLVINLTTLPANMVLALPAMRQSSQNRSVYILGVSDTHNREEMGQLLAWGANACTLEGEHAHELYLRLLAGLAFANVYAHYGQEKARIDQLQVEITEDLQRMAQLQREHLPGNKRYAGVLKSFSYFQPAGPVSRQSMNVIELADGHIGFFHLNAQTAGLLGVAQAMTLHRRLSDAADESRSTLSQYMNQGFSPGAVLREINSWILQESPPNSTVYSLCYGVFDPNTGDARIAHAGYPTAVLSRARGELEHVGAYGPPLGVSVDASFQDVFFSLNPGDRLFVFSNSLNEHPALGDNFVQAGHALFTRSGELEFDALTSYFDQTLPQNQAHEHPTPSADIALLAFQFGEHIPVELEAFNPSGLAALGAMVQQFKPTHACDFTRAVSTRVPAQATLIPEISSMLGQWMTHCGLDDLLIGNIQLCLFEIVSNLCRHAGLASSDFFHIHMALNQQEQVLLQIIDEGRPIPTDKLAQARTHDFDFDITQDDQIPLGGMGLALVDTLSSEFTVHTHNGTNHTLVWFEPTAD